MGKIPKIIHQTWNDEEDNLSEFFVGLINKWKLSNPDFEHRYYSESDRLSFIKENFEEKVYRAYCRIIPGAYKADLWRYCILYNYGGFYVDIDTLAIGSLKPLLEKDSHLITLIDFNRNVLEGNHNLANGFIGVTSGSEIMLRCIDNIVEYVDTNKIPTSKLDFSGPGNLGRSVNVYLGNKETESFVGKEGFQNEKGIYFLKFEENTENVYDIYNQENIIFQNKNGNQELALQYEDECKKGSVKSWLSFQPFRMMPPRIMIYNGYSFHYEMFGYLLDFFKTFGITNVDVITNQYDMEWFVFYQKLGYTFRIVNTKEELGSYNLVIFLTDDDKTYTYPYQHYMLAIDHTSQLRNSNVKFHIGVKYFQDNPSQLYALPVYKRLSKQEKLDKLSSQSKINIILLGGGSVIKKIEELSFLNSGDREIQYHILNRNLYQELDSIKKDIRYKKKKKLLPKKTSFSVYLFCESTVLFELLSISHYIFINTHEEYLSGDKMSAAIPLAFSNGCQLIMPQEMNTTYNFASPIFYQDKNHEVSVSLNPDLNAVYSEMSKLIIHRDRNLIEMFDRMFYNFE